MYRVSLSALLGTAKKEAKPLLCELLCCRCFCRVQKQKCKRFEKLELKNAFIFVLPQLLLYVCVAVFEYA